MTRDLSCKPHMSFGRKIEGRTIVQHLGPVFSSKKAAVKLFGGKLNDKLETEFDEGLELLYAKAKSMGGSGVVNVGFRVTDNAPYYLMWGDAVVVERS